MYSDVHIHTNFSGDCHVPAKAQIEKAILLGMKELCITDHHDYDVVSDTDFTLDLDSYFPFMERLKTQYAGQIRILIGIELGLQLHIKEYLEDLAGKYPFDFMIGSSHFVDGLDPYFPEYFEGKTERQGYERYFESTLARVRNLDCYDSFGHLDYVVRYGPHKNRNYCYSDYRDYIDPILKTLIEKGKGLECNTGGFKYGLGHPNPCEDILSRYRELGGEILTLGSDAHAPEQIGYDFKRLHDLLTNCGFRYYTIYEHRKPIFHRL